MKMQSTGRHYTTAVRFRDAGVELVLLIKLDVNELAKEIACERFK